MVQVVVDKYFSKNARQRMKNASAKGCELVYEVSQRVLEKAKKTSQIDIVENLLKIDGVLNVNQVEQTDDISR